MHRSSMKWENFPWKIYIQVRISTRKALEVGKYVNPRRRAWCILYVNISAVK